MVRPMETDSLGRKTPPMPNLDEARSTGCQVTSPDAPYAFSLLSYIMEWYERDCYGTIHHGLGGLEHRSCA